MNIPKQASLGGYPSPEAKQAQSSAIRKVYRQAAKQLTGFQFKVHFNKGGIAVYGETYAKIYMSNPLTSYTFTTPDIPCVEAYDTTMGLLVRQWDGRNSGANHYVQTLEQFVSIVRELAAKPFIRF